MLKKINKKKPVSVIEAEPADADDQTHAAAKTYTKQELRKKNTQFVMRKDREKAERQQAVHDAGNSAIPYVNFTSGLIMSFVSGTVLCALTVKTFGVLIVIGSVIYALAKFWGAE